MKNKIRALKLFTIILTILIVILELTILFFIIKYLIKNDHKVIGLLLGVSIFFIQVASSSLELMTSYENFEENEVSKWESLTPKRIIKFMVKYHLGIMTSFLDSI